MSSMLIQFKPSDPAHHQQRGETNPQVLHRLADCSLKGIVQPILGNFVQERED